MSKMLDTGFAGAKALLYPSATNAGTVGHDFMVTDCLIMSASSDCRDSVVSSQVVHICLSKRPEACIFDE